MDRSSLFYGHIATARRNFIEYFCIALASFISLVLLDVLISFKGELFGLSKTASAILKYLFQGIAFIFLALFFQWVATRARDNRWWRRKIDPRAEFEGTWFELVFRDNEFSDGKLNFEDIEASEEKSGEQVQHGAEDGAEESEKVKPRYAVFEIRYLGSKDDSYWMSGSLYFPNGTYHSLWRTGSLIFSHRDKRLDYLYTADLIANPGLIKGLGSLTFRRVISGIYDEVRGGGRRVNSRPTSLHSGAGYLLEDGKEVTRSSLEFIRITREEVKALVPNMRAYHGAEIMREFVRRYHEKFGEHLQDGLMDPLRPSHQESSTHSTETSGSTASASSTDSRADNAVDAAK